MFLAVNSQFFSGGESLNASFNVTIVPEMGVRSKNTGQFWKVAGVGIITAGESGME